MNIKKCKKMSSWGGLHFNQLKDYNVQENRKT